MLILVWSVWLLYVWYTILWVLQITGRQQSYNSVNLNRLWSLMLLYIEFTWWLSRFVLCKWCLIVLLLQILMRFLIQRVKEANVYLPSLQQTRHIDIWLVVSMWVSTNDLENNREHVCQTFARRVWHFKLFEKESSSMVATPSRTRCSLLDISGEILLISNFTLMWVNKKWSKIDFLRSASFDDAKPIYEYQISCFRDQWLSVVTWEFGAEMHVSSVNNWPINLVFDY